MTALLTATRESLDATTRFWMVEQEVETLRWAMDTLDLDVADRQRIVSRLRELQAAPARLRVIA